MATKSKIKAILNDGNWHEKSKNWYYDLEMENGDKGSKGVKTKDSLKIGQELEYNLEEDGRGGYRIKTVQTVFSKAYDRASNNIDNQIGQMVGNAITNACSLFAHGKIEKDKLEVTAQWICEISMKLKEQFKDK